MAKTIKFNLICDGNPVRTLEDLQNNFSIEDVLEYYDNKLLQKWLAVRGYSDQLEKVNSIAAEDAITILFNLIDIFEIEADKEKACENTFILKYKKEREFLLEEYKKMDYKSEAIISDYHAGYRELINTIIDNKDDIIKIKAAIIEMETHYFPLFELNHRALFYDLLQEAPMALFCMVMREKVRQFYIPMPNESASNDKKAMYDLLCKLLTFDKPNEILGSNLLSFSGVTEGYWKDLEAKGKQFLILKIEQGNFVRGAAASGVELSSVNINNEFVILDGLDYKSNNASHKLLYMEV